MATRKPSRQGPAELRRPIRFPFSAVVGQDDVKLALILNAVDPGIGGVLLRGHKGSAKSTLVRGLAGLLPGGAPFVELPVGATEDRLVGSFDLTAAITEGVQRFTPGLLALAHQGVLYVDEVNLLPDHLVDVLLDVAASGVNRVERDGVSHEHHSRFVLAGSMNPEEGDLRPQLLDRFGLAAEVIASSDPTERAEAVARRLAFDAEPVDFVAEWAAEESALRARLADVAGTVRRSAPDSVPLVDDRLMWAVSVLCAEMGVEGLRADIVICRAAGALALWEGRKCAEIDDVARVAPLALAHRRRRSPLGRNGVDQEELANAMESARSRVGNVPPTGTSDPGDGNWPTVPAPARSGLETAPPVPAGDPGAGARGILHSGAGSGGVAREAGRSRDRSARVEGPRGRVVGSRRPEGAPSAIALRATVVAAAERGAGGVALAAAGSVRGGGGLADVDDAQGRQAGGREVALLIAPDDIREQVRVERAGRLVVFALDTSGSMGVQSRIAVAKQAVAGLLLDAYASRDRVALVSFRAGGAEVALAPTGSVEVASHRLDQLATGGSTPLAEGIRVALDVAATAKSSGRRPFLVLVSDGRATAAADGEDPVEAALCAASEVGIRNVPALVVDAEQGPVRLGLARRLADAMSAECISLDDLEHRILRRG